MCLTGLCLDAVLCSSPNAVFCLPLGGRFAEPLFPGEFPLQGSLLNYPMGGMGGYSDPLSRSTPSTAFQKRDMSFRGYPDNTGGQRLGGSADGFGLGGGRDGGFGQEGLLGESPGSRYLDEFSGGQMESGSGQGLMGVVPETSSLPSTLLKYLVSGTVCVCETMLSNVI